MHSQIGALSRWLESYYLPSSRYKLGSSSSSGADKTPETKLHYYYFFSFVYHGYTYRQAHVCVCVSLTLPYLTLLSALLPTIPHRNLPPSSSPSPPLPELTVYIFVPVYIPYRRCAISSCSRSERGTVYMYILI